MQCDVDYLNLLLTAMGLAFLTDGSDSPFPEFARFRPVTAAITNTLISTAVCDAQREHAYHFGQPTSTRAKVLQLEPLQGLRSTCQAGHQVRVVVVSGIKKRLG